MSHHSAAIAALETRARWLDWFNKARHGRLWRTIPTGATELYAKVLAEGETFCMDEHFSSLTTHAAAGVPDELRFEQQWLIRPSGFLYLQQPVSTPLPKSAWETDLGKPLLGAVGWTTLPTGMQVAAAGAKHGIILTKPTSWFACFIDFERMAGEHGIGFGAWSYFLIQDGVACDERQKQFEDHQRLVDPEGAYKMEEERDGTIHEIRWLYSAFHLMAQRVATRVRQPTDRGTRRRFEKQNRTAPPFIEVVTLRRLSNPQPRREHAEVDWQYQWSVRGHWRNQWFGREGVHKPVFIESFIKGPPDKPLKEHGTKLFIAKR